MERKRILSSWCQPSALSEIEVEGWYFQNIITPFEDPVRGELGSDASIKERLQGAGCSANNLSTNLFFGSAIPGTAVEKRPGS